jgi:hypothetical protein
MKTFIVLASALVCLTLWGCKEDTLQPDKSKNTSQGNEKGTLYGSTNQWVFVGGYSSAYWDEKQSGVKIEVIGSSISTETNGYGEFKLTGLDSGTYSIRFSKKGFETVILDSVKSNGKDSLRVTLIIKDSLGHKAEYQEVFLRELTPIISVRNANATASETIKIDTIKSEGQIRDIRRDTSYSWQGEFSIELRSDVKATQDNLDVGYYIAISNSQTVDESLIPIEFSASQPDVKKGWIAYYGSSVKTKPVYTGTRDFVVNSSGKNADNKVALGSTIMDIKVSKEQQLYLHIIPVTVKKILRQKSNRFNTWLEFGGGYNLGEMKTIPIEWK